MFVIANTLVHWTKKDVIYCPNPLNGRFAPWTPQTTWLRIDRGDFFHGILASIGFVVPAVIIYEIEKNFAFAPAERRVSKQTAQWLCQMIFLYVSHLFA